MNLQIQQVLSLVFSNQLKSNVGLIYNCQDTFHSLAVT